MNITAILQHQASQFPNEIAIVDRVGRQNRQTSFAEFDASVDQMTQRLVASGLTAGDTVLLFHPMSAELYVAMAAILRCGMNVMFVDPSAGRQYIDHCCRLLPPQALVACPKAHLLRLRSPALRRIRLKWSLGGRLPFTGCMHGVGGRSEMDQGFVHACSPDTPALISFTSGSTGQPKAAVRTHGFLLAQHRAVEQNFSLRAGEADLVTMPIFVLANLASRVTSVIADADLRRPGQIVPEPVIEQIRDQHIDRITASPAFLNRIVGCCQQHGRQLPSLRKVFTGGGPVPMRLLDRLQEVAPNAEITAVYGSTEAEPISTVNVAQMSPQDAAAVRSGQGLLVGKPVASLQVRIIRDCWGQALGALSDDEFIHRCQPAGQPGEIVVSGDHVLPGYLNGNSDKETKFRVDQTRWHRTGDAGYFDHLGRLWLLGRCAARIDDRHGAIYPLGVEQAAVGNPVIGHAAMVSHRGQRVLAVTLRDPKSRPDLAPLQKSLSFANIDSIRVLKRLPVDQRHQSKIDYSSLRELLEQ